MIAKEWPKDFFFGCIVLVSFGSLALFLLVAHRNNTPFSVNNDISVKSAAVLLDKAFEADLAEHNLTPTGRADSLLVIRRLALALAGTLPSVEELRELEKVNHDDRVDSYVSHLLEDKRTFDNLAERFARVFVGVEEGPFLVYRRNRFTAWLSEQLQRNTSYRDLTMSMLTSDGIWTDEPQVNFYTYNIIPDSDAENRPDPVRLTGRISRAFLGMRIDCLQCHDDFLGTMNLGSADDPIGGVQLNFHALAAFFSQVENSLVGINDDLNSRPYQYKLLDEAEESAITPKVPFNEEFDNSDEANLRLRLANWVTHDFNRPFARAAVNRIWAIMFNTGCIQPVDDIPLAGPFPPGLEVLVDDFVNNGYDLHRLIRVIACSQTFQRDSAAEFEILPIHVSKYAVFPMIRLRPEQVAGAVAQSTSLKTIDSMSHIIARLVKYGQENEFVGRFGDFGEEEFNDRSETITQRLLMMNGEMISDRITNRMNSATRIALLAPNMKKAVETIFLSTLIRLPTETESRYFVSQLEELNGDARNKKISDIYWTLINSVEFVWNH